MSVRNLLGRVKRAVQRTISPSSGHYHDQWSRIVMNKETERLIKSLKPETCSTLEISGTDWKGRGFREYRSVDYPDYDVCASILPERFDIIIAEQVFEHLLWPYRAVRNVFTMLKPGGAFLVTTPFLIKVHDVPVDCSRWTETGIKYFLAEGGFQLDKTITGSWGNRACVKSFFKRWTAYNPAIHSLANEPAFPIVVWALARKAI